MAPIVVTVSALVVDCQDPGRVAAFWQQLLGGDVVPFPEQGVIALRAPGVTFDFSTVPEPKETKNRWHLDVASEDPAATVKRVLELGGSRADDIHRSDRFTVMRDPAGNEFCVLADADVGPWAPSVGES